MPKKPPMRMATRHSTLISSRSVTDFGGGGGGGGGGDGERARDSVEEEGFRYSTNALSVILKDVMTGTIVA